MVCQKCQELLWELGSATTEAVAIMSDITARRKAGQECPHTLLQWSQESQDARDRILFALRDHKETHFSGATFRT
jgi:hypothetical protein